MMQKKWYLSLSISLLTLFNYPEQVLAHGATIKYRLTNAIQIQATYDDGQPIANGQVTVYSPDDPNTPWLQGKTDSSGYFYFVPSEAKTGSWDIRVRQAGHGGFLSIPVNAIANNSSSQPNWSQPDSHYHPWQKGLIAITGVWGFIGTALFFQRLSQNQNS